MYNNNNLFLVDTYKWKKRPIRLVINCIKAIKSYDNVVILPAHNGVKIFVPMFAFLNKIYKKNIIYVVVGGWLADLIHNNKILICLLKKINYILVETNGLKKKLNNLKIDNVKVMLNFKDINVLTKNEISFSYKEHYKLCTFSRVMEKKGISDAINAIACINEQYQKTIYKLDIYGPIEENYKEKFNILLNKYKKYVTYKGVVESSKSVEVIRKYDLLLFPTRFKTEGLPGTTIDAFSSGIPTVYSSWDYCDEFYKDKYNGIKFEMGNIENLKKILDNFYNRKYDVNKMKRNCIESAKKYDSSNAIRILIDCLR